MIALWAVAPGPVEAHFYYGSLQYSVRYSPYAFDYHHSGLVGGGITYSPYALSYHNSGLVSKNVRYTPYALSYNNSGLIADHCGSYAPCYFISSGRYPCQVDHSGCQCTQRHACPSFAGLDSCDNAKVSHAAASIACQARIKQIENSGKEIRSPREQDGTEVIRRYLESKNVQNFNSDQLLRVDNRTVSVNFWLRDRNMIIKYWNAEAIQALADGPQYRRNYYERYKKDWEDLCSKYQQEGGKVYHISSSDKQGIISLLELCPEINAG